MCFCLDFLENYAKHIMIKINKTIFRTGMISTTMCSIFVKKPIYKILFQIVQYQSVVTQYINNEYNLCNF